MAKLLVTLALLLASCAPIPACDQVSCEHPKGKWQGDSIIGAEIEDDSN